MADGVIVLCTGGRDFADKAALYRVLEWVHRHGPVRFLLHGDAPGADTLAGEWADEHGVLCMPLDAPWDEIKKLCGKAAPAGALRNQMMVRAVSKMGGRKVVVACPGDVGTADCVKRAKKAGLKVIGLDGKES